MNSAKKYQLPVEWHKSTSGSFYTASFLVYDDCKEVRKMNQEVIGSFIAKCRKEKGLTQMQLAEKLNITNRAVSKWETGVSHS